MPAPSDEFVVDGVVYRCRHLCARAQHEMLRHVEPVMPMLVRTDAGLRFGGLDASALVTLLAPLRDAPDDITDAVFEDVRAAVERIDGEALGSLPLPALMTLTAEVVRHNFGKMRAMRRPDFVPCPAGENDKGFGELGPATMPDGLDWLYAPMGAGYCAFHEYEDGSLRIEDVQRMNDLIAVRAENEARLRLAAEQG